MTVSSQAYRIDTQHGGNGGKLSDQYRKLHVRPSAQIVKLNKHLSRRRLRRQDPDGDKKAQVYGDMSDKHNLLCAGNIMRKVDVDDAGQDCDGNDEERSLPVGESVAVVVDQDDGLNQSAGEKEALGIASLPGKRRHPSGDVAEEFLIPAWVSLQQ